MAKIPGKNGNPQLRFTRAEDIELPVFEPSGLLGIRTREWTNLRKAITRLPSNTNKLETLFNISATSFISFLIAFLTTPGNISGWKAFFGAVTMLSVGVAVISLIAWSDERERRVTDKQDALDLMDEIDSFYKEDPSRNNSFNTIEEPIAPRSDQAAIFTQPTDQELFDDAKKLAYDTGKISTSMLQRRLKIGYGRASRIVDELENQGIVGESDGARPRVVLNKDKGLNGPL